MLEMYQSRAAGDYLPQRSMPQSLQPTIKGTVESYGPPKSDYDLKLF